MFWSKIWLFLVALGAAAALTVALALPPAAHRERVRDERQRLATACDVVGIELELAARNHVDLIGTFARAAEIVGGLEQVDPGMPLDAEKGKRLRQTAGTLVSQIKVAGADPDAPTPPGLRPNFAWMLDASGRAVARWGLDEDDTGDVLAGRWLVDDALAGYLRDDVWLDKGTLYMVAGAPVVSRGDKGFVGAVLMGWRLDLDVSAQFVQAFKDTDQDAEDRSINIGFFGGGKAITKSSRDVNLDSDILDRYGAVDKPEELGEDCRRIAPFFAHDGKHEYAVTVARLPGEIASQDGFFALYTPRPAAPSFGAAVGKAKHELGGGFPWALVIVGFVVAFAGGVVLMVLEADRPLRRLQADAVKLAKGDGERMAEDQHHGRFGSIARSVNIQIDKVSRDAKAAKKDLDQLLGPAPEGSLGAVDLLGGVPPSPSLPGMSLPPRPAAPAAPPPSEFRFGDQGAAPARPAAGPDLDLGPARPAPGMAPARPAAPPTPPPLRPPVPGGRNPTPPPRPPVPAAKKALDDDILSFDEPSGEAAAASDGGDDAYFREVFDQFVELKKKCGEATGGLTFQKFGDKLRKNQKELIARTGCTEVKFTVYVKDGKAALKATPVKEA